MTGIKFLTFNNSLDFRLQWWIGLSSFLKESPKIPDHSRGSVFWPEPGCWYQKVSLEVQPTIKIIVPNLRWLKFPTKKIVFGEVPYSFDGQLGLPGKKFAILHPFLARLTMGIPSPKLSAYIKRHDRLGGCLSIPYK